MKEIWKNTSFERYEISNLGRVRNSKTKKAMKVFISSQNYLSITLRISVNCKKNFRIHRLIAEAFIPNPENKPCINHIDNDTRNNSVNNLEWCTQKENMQTDKRMPKNWTIISSKKIKKLYLDNPNIPLKEFVDLLLESK